METNVFSWTALLAQVVNLALVVLIGYAIYVCLRRKRVNPVKQMSTMDKPIGEVIRERRMRCILTQEFVAEQLGVSRQAVSKWESGTSLPSTANLVALAKLFQIPADELLKSGRNDPVH